MTKVSNGATSIARRVRDYLDGHPVEAEALRLGIGNHSAIARRAASELGLRPSDAIVAACRRYPARRGVGEHAEGVRRVLRRSRIETRTKVAAITATQGPDVLQRLGDVIEELLDENLLCRVIQVSRGTVVIVDEESVGRVVRQLRDERVIGVRRNLIELAVTGPGSIEATPGLLAFLTGILAAQEINVVEAMSCYTDTIFLLDQSDMTAAIGYLTKALE